MKLEKYSMGIGDRFGRQGKAQLQAFIQAKDAGIDITPVWNKSYREHQIVGTEPVAVRQEADTAVEALGWTGPYFVDADHIGMKTVERFIPASDFFTLDVADFTGKTASENDVWRFVEKYSPYVGSLVFPEIETPLQVTRELLETVARSFLPAVREAGRIYRRVADVKGEGNFITEVSMDETENPQTPVELFFILAAIADEAIPAQTIAPKFSGRFNKGVDYVGDLEQFEKEFNQDLAVLAQAVQRFGLPADLKLSVHSGSDKFSIYPLMGNAVLRRGAGLHLKTAGTTWLEEIIGLAEAGGAGLEIAKEIYRRALQRIDELCRPYAAVIDIDRSKLPHMDTVDRWDGTDFAAALRHDPGCSAYNLHFRQLLHVGFKIAAEIGAPYLAALAENETVVAHHVCENLFDRHIRRLFMA